MTTNLRLEISDPPLEGESPRLADRLLEFNLGKRGGNWQPLQILVRDPGGAIVGGLAGGSRWGRGEIDTLWLEETVRGRGFGRELLERAEREFRARGCGWIDLETFEFQAPHFYRKAGYQVLFERETSPEGGARKFWLRKALRSWFTPAAPPPPRA
jgi:ribosomal protein S18 acetylase RimI-like enzyme